MPDGHQRRYLYVAIDRATRWVFLLVGDSRSVAGARAFLRQLTDNGKAFMGQSSRGGQRSPSATIRWIATANSRALSTV